MRGARTPTASPEIEKLLEMLGKVPGLGPRSARRAALQLLKKRDQVMRPLAEALTEAADRVAACSACGALDTMDPCAICAAPGRDDALLCVVAAVGDVWALERAGAFQGRYHVLGRVLPAPGGVRPDPAVRNITELESSARSLNESLELNLQLNYQPRRLN